MRLSPLESAVLSTATILTPREQAIVYDTTYATIRQIRSGLIRRGLLQSRYRRWTPCITENVVSSLQDGLPTFRAARNYGVRTTTVRKRMAVYGGVRRIRYGFESHLALSAVRTGRQLARMLGVSEWTIYELCQAGAIKYNRTGYTQPRNRGKPWHYLIADDDLMTFLEDRRWWMWYNPASIGDPDWRQMAVQARQASHGEWITVSTYANRYHFTPRHVRRLCQKGRLDCVKQAANWFIWESKTAAD